MMNMDQIMGLAKKVKGSVRQRIGRATGNRAMQIRGMAEKSAGQVQKACGDMKAMLRKTI
jgi:uncharacterized protein YjbJ (UPF0337 family)